MASGKKGGGKDTPAPPSPASSQGASKLSARAEKTFARVRRSIENAIEVQEEERRRKLLTQRLELARTGIVAYQKNQFVEAVKCFHAYIRVLEEIKEVKEGELTPVLFDRKEDLPELFMISGIYWDLAKIHDRMKSAEKEADFFHYLNKYILFSLNLPHQKFCSDTLKKYLRNKKAVHQKEFREAYTTLSGSKCFIATSLVDLTDEQCLLVLRRFKSEQLEPNVLGRVFIHLYDFTGPKAAWLLNRLPEGVRFLAGQALERITKRIARHQTFSE